jgi:iron complex transport system ATP-binding protein
VGGVTLAARGLRVSLGGRDVLAGVDAEFDLGWTAVVGPNGAGKSTLLRALAGLLPARAGTVALDGRDLAGLAPRERARGIAWLAQAADSSGDLTVRETVALGRIAHLGLWGAAGADDDAAVDAAMAATECAGWADRRLLQLSGGERQRVLLARALATEAPRLLLDEPTTHLDAPHQVALARLFRRLAATRTVVTVLHDLPIAVHADRLLVMARGRVVARGAPADPALREALGEVFGGAVRVVAGPGVAPRLELALEDAPAAAATAPPRAAVSWSGGKDACLAWLRARESGLPVVTFVTMCEAGGEGLSHALPRAVLAAQAQACGVAWRPVDVPRGDPGDYARAFDAALAALRADGHTHVVFGDIDLAAHRDWLSPRCAAAGLEAVFPLWGETRAAIAREVIERGIRARVVAVDLARLPADLCGADYDAALLERLPPGACPCGEDGEFHTVVTSAPGMDGAVPLRVDGVRIEPSRPPLAPTRFARLALAPVTPRTPPDPRP